MQALLGTVGSNIWCYDCLDLFLEGGANGEETETEEDGASKSF